MYEIIANPEDYQIDQLINGTGNAAIELSQEERDTWAKEITNFGERLGEFSKKASELAGILSSEDKISATPSSLKTLKIQLFNINDAINSALDIAQKLETDIVKK
jgi:hypothetical protein